MQKQILEELRALKNIVATIAGTAGLPEGERFSAMALEKAAKEFQKLAIARKEWVEEPYYGAGAFIRQHFGFTHYFKRGRTYFYNRKDLDALMHELKKRRVDLKRYMEYIADREKFKKNIADAAASKKRSRRRASYEIPDELFDISTSLPKAPAVELVKADIERLKQEFFDFGLKDYVDIYKSNYAMTKFVYEFEKYIDPVLKKRSRRWCDDFNYAHHALELPGVKRERFIPVKYDDMIEL